MLCKQVSTPGLILRVSSLREEVFGQKSVMAPNCLPNFTCQCWGLKAWCLALYITDDLYLERRD